MSGCASARPLALAAAQPPGLRIGIITFHRCINYGSYWQARCLAEGLRARGYDAVLLDHTNPQISRTERRCALQPLLPVRSSKDEIKLYACKVRSFERAFAALPLSRSFPLDRPEAMERYDLVVIGSDEVWNLRHPWYGGWPVFFGDGVPTQRIVAYAASFGNYDAEGGLDRQRAAQLDGFAAISVRDDNSRQLVKGALGRTPELVLDPCLQFPPAPPARSNDADEPPFALVYGHSFAGWFARQARDWAVRRGIRLLSVGYRNDWADRHEIDAGPLEFASLVAKSTAVLTNFFHGCVFAVLNAKPFACASSPYRMNKVRGLTRMLDAERHMVGAPASERDFAALLDQPLSSAIAGAITRSRSRSDAYLRSALGG